jgi:site-specific recombinase XerD
MATRLAEDGASASEIQHILGHESLNSSQTYIDATFPPLPEAYFGGQGAVGFRE